MKLLIWDIDGTLLDCGSAGRKAMDKTFKNMFDIDNGFSGVPMSGRLDSVIINDAFKNHGIDKCDLDEFYSKYEEELRVVLKDHDVKVCEGIIELLEYFSVKDNFVNTIATGNCEVGARLKLESGSISKYFNLGGYGCSFKERHELVSYVIETVKNSFKIDIDNKNIFVIGDTPHDIISGKKAGVNSIAVLTGDYKEIELEKYEPTYIFKNFRDIRNVIEVLER